MASSEATSIRAAEHNPSWKEPEDSRAELDDEKSKLAEADVDSVESLFPGGKERSISPKDSIWNQMSYKTYRLTVVTEAINKGHEFYS